MIGSAQVLIITDELDVLLIPSVGATFQTITTQKSYTEIVVVCAYILKNTINREAVVRIDQATSNTFDILIQKADDDLTPGDVCCVIADEGEHTFLPDGTFYEADTVESVGTNGRNFGWVFKTKME